MSKPLTPPLGSRYNEPCDVERDPVYREMLRTGWLRKVAPSSASGS